jgi:hypothetical protein
MVEDLRDDGRVVQEVLAELPAHLLTLLLVPSAAENG